MGDETALANWEINKSTATLWASIVTLIFFGAAFFSFFAVYLVSKSTNFVLLIIPAIFVGIFLATLPEFFKTLKAYSQNAMVYITERGVYLRPLPQGDKYNFLAWELMVQYDEIPFISKSFLGFLFPKPTRFVLRGQYEEDTFAVEAVGDDADILRAYLKEHQVKFGFLKNG